MFYEYIWIDGTAPTAKVRNKTKFLPFQVPLHELPNWGFDGSSTNQADGHNSDLELRPVHMVPNPLRPGNGFLVLCEVFNPDGTPHASNTRAKLRDAVEGLEDQKILVGFEQEYTMMRDGRPLGWPEGNSYPRPQGPYYCGVGADDVAGRKLVDLHADACVYAGLFYEGSNAEVLLGQWEYQIGAGSPLTMSDHLWLSRWLLYRLGEDLDIYITLHPKPIAGDWNGTGCHTNFSTEAMRADGGLTHILKACERLGKVHEEHIAVYGADNHLRLTGKHETCSINQFRYGVSDRGASIRIPLHVSKQGYGYFEDRRPAANCDPYMVSAQLVKTVCLP